MSQETPQLKPRLRATFLAIATGLIGWGLPEMGIGSGAIPWVVAVGSLLATIAIITDDWVKLVANKLSNRNGLQVVLGVSICILVVVGSYCGSAKLIDNQESKDQVASDKEALRRDTENLIQDITSFKSEMNLLIFELTDSYWASPELGMQAIRTQREIANSIFTDNYEQRVYELGNRLLNQGVITEKQQRSLNFNMQTQPIYTLDWLLADLNEYLSMIE